MLCVQLESFETLHKKDDKYKQSLMEALIKTVMMCARLKKKSAQNCLKSSR